MRAVAAALASGRRRNVFRPWSSSRFLGNAAERQLSRLKAAAISGGPHENAAYLRALGKVRPHDVIATMESGQVSSSMAATVEYVRALSSVKLLNPDKLPFVVTALNNSMPTTARSSPERSASITVGSSYFAKADQNAFSDTTALKVALAEPSLQVQLWRLVRVLGTAILLVGFLGVLLEERGGSAVSRIKTGAEPEPDDENPVMFVDVAGAEEAKVELEEIVAYLREPTVFTRLGGKVPSGVLLVGPPGTGKTLLAKAVAGEAKVPFYYASGSSFEEMYVGVGAKRVRELFAAAQANSPCIVFIDEIDAMGAKRSPKDAAYTKLAFFELLQALDGFRSSDSVICIAATNDPEALDSALTRPGRFDMHVQVPLPDVRGRLEVLKVHTRRIAMSKNVDLEVIARGTPGFSGAALAELVNSAAVRASVEREQAVAMTHLESAKEKILMGPERASAFVDIEARRLTALHEGGHAVAALYTDGALKVHKATIVPRGNSLGMCWISLRDHARMVTQLPSKDETSVSRRQMLARLVVCMGGRAAEELILGELDCTSGAQSDFKQASRLAEAMVTQFGFSKELGPMVYDRATESPHTRALIEAEMKLLLDQALAQAKDLLRERTMELRNIVVALLDRETLSGEEVGEAANGRLPCLSSHNPDVAELFSSETQQVPITGTAAASMPSV